MDYNGRIEDVVKRLEANYVVKKYLKNTFSRGSLSFGRKEAKLYLPIVRKRERKLKRTYKNLTGKIYYRTGDIVKMIDTARRKYCD